jgi:hypothetical protein
MLLGFGTQAAAVAAVFHIINHADLQGRALHDGGDRRSRDAYTRHQAAGGPEAPDADHLPDRHGCGAVHGGNTAFQRVPVQGDDAGGGLAHLLGRERLGGARACDAGRASVRGLLVPLRRPRFPRPRARRLSAQTSRPALRDVGRAGAAGGAGHRDRRGTLPCRGYRDRRGQRRDRSRAAPASEDMARGHTGALDVDDRHRRRRDPAAASPAARQGMDRHPAARGEGHLRPARGSPCRT